MFRNRRFACAVLGAWLGIGACIDLLTGQNFAAVDRFLSDPSSPRAATQIGQAGATSVRFILRRNAAEENASVLNRWEWTQIGFAIAVFLMAIFGDRPARSALGLVPVMLLIILLQLIVVTPHMASLGREVDEIPGNELLNNVSAGRLAAFTGAFWGGEVLKTLLGIGLAWKLMLRRERSRSTDSAISGADASKPERRVRRRRTSHSHESKGL